MFRATGISTSDWHPFKLEICIRLVVFWKGEKRFGLHGTPGPKSGSNFGTEGATLFKRPLGTGEIVAHNFDSGLPKCHTRTRELAPAVRDHNDMQLAL